MAGIERKSCSPRAPYSPTALAIHNARYGLARDLAVGKRVLDIACGEGLGAAQLMGWGAASVIAVDLDHASILAARKTFGNVPNLSFAVDDACDFLERTDDCFDLIVCIETVEHVPVPARLLRGLARVRAPGGHVVLSCPNDPFYYGPGPSLNPHHVSTFDFAEIKSLSEAALGAARWFGGTTLAGFATVPMDGPAIALRALYDETPQNGFPTPDTHVQISGGPEGRLLGEDGKWLYYMGVFGDNTDPLRPAIGQIAADPTVSQNRPSLWNRTQRALDGKLRFAVLGATTAQADALAVLGGKRLDLTFLDAVGPFPDDRAFWRQTHLLIFGPMTPERLIGLGVADRGGFMEMAQAFAWIDTATPRSKPAALFDATAPDLLQDMNWNERRLIEIASRIDAKAASKVAPLRRLLARELLSY